MTASTGNSVTPTCSPWCARATSFSARPSSACPATISAQIGLALDTGANGLIVPVVNTPEEAREIVYAAKFPPLGGRSYGGRRPIDLRGRGYSDTANEDVILVAQIESPEAVENAESIAAVPGVDALFLGPDDIMLRRGHSMIAPRSPEALRKDLERVISACRKHGKFGVMVGGSGRNAESDRLDGLQPDRGRRRRSPSSPTPPRPRPPKRARL